MKIEESKSTKTVKAILTVEEYNNKTFSEIKKVVEQKTKTELKFITFIFSYDFSFVIVFDVVTK